MRNIIVARNPTPNLIECSCSEAVIHKDGCFVQFQVEDSDLFMRMRHKKRSDSSELNCSNVPLVGLQPLEVFIFALSNERGGLGCHGCRMYGCFRCTYLPIGTCDGWWGFADGSCDERCIRARPGEEDAFAAILFAAGGFTQPRIQTRTSRVDGRYGKWESEGQPPAASRQA